MRCFIILALLQLSCTVFAQQSVHSGNPATDSILLHLANSINGTWKIIKRIPAPEPVLRYNKLVFTNREILFFENDSMLSKTVYRLEPGTIPNGLNIAPYFLVRFTQRNDYWIIHLFDKKVKPGSLLINTDPTCACSCPLELYERVVNTGNTAHQKNK